MREYRLVSKNNKGCIWYIGEDQLFSGPYVTAHDKDGFETTVDIRNYEIHK